MILALPLLLAIAPVTFNDDHGEHRVSFVVSPVRTRGDTKSQRLDVKHEWRKNSRGRWNVAWEAKDFVNDCEFDLTLELLEKSISVTDLDGNGRKEISFLYVLGCRSDVSPLTLKLLMYEGDFDGVKKLALRGENELQVGEENGKPVYGGGSFQADPAFDKAPPSFLAHAKKQWDTFKRSP